MIPPQIFAIGGILILGIWSLIRLRQNFSMRLFYTIGVWLFLIQVLANTYGLYIDFNYIPDWAKISRVGSVLFTALLTYLFYYLRKTAPASMGGAGTQLSPEEINAFLDDEDEKVRGTTFKKLRRPCVICEEYFEPTGKACRMCEDCREERRKEVTVRLKEKREALKNG